MLVHSQRVHNSQVVAQYFNRKHRQKSVLPGPVAWGGFGQVLYRGCLVVAGLGRHRACLGWGRHKKVWQLQQHAIVREGWAPNSRCGGSSPTAWSSSSGEAAARNTPLLRIGVPAWVPSCKKCRPCQRKTRPFWQRLANPWTTFATKPSSANLMRPPKPCWTCRLDCLLRAAVSSC